MDWQALGSVTGAVLLGATGLQALGATFAHRRRRRHAEAGYSIRHEAFDARLQTVLQWARAAKPIFKVWSGTRVFRVGAIVDEATDCKSFYLVPVDGRPLPRFEPGQFLTFSLPMDSRQKPLVRCYSLSDRPREDYFRVTVKQAHPSIARAEAPPGVGSSFFHSRALVGSMLEVQAPQGSFFLDPTDNRPVVLIGGGIGVTPLVSMLNSIAHEGTDRTAYLFAGFRNSQEHPFRKHLRELDTTHEKLHFDISYSRPMPADNLQRDYHHRGRIDVNHLRRALPSNNFRFYVCGPPGISNSRRGASEWVLWRDSIARTRR